MEKFIKHLTEIENVNPLALMLPEEFYEEYQHIVEFEQFQTLLDSFLIANYSVKDEETNKVTLNLKQALFDILVLNLGSRVFQDKKNLVLDTILLRSEKTNESDSDNQTLNAAMMFTLLYYNRKQLVEKSIDVMTPEAIQDWANQKNQHKQYYRGFELIMVKHFVNLKLSVNIGIERDYFYGEDVLILAIMNHIVKRLNQQNNGDLNQLQPDVTIFE